LCCKERYSSMSVRWRKCPKCGAGHTSSQSYCPECRRAYQRNYYVNKLRTQGVDVSPRKTDERAMCSICGLPKVNMSTEIMGSPVCVDCDADLRRVLEMGLERTLRIVGWVREMNVSAPDPKLSNREKQEQPPWDPRPWNEFLDVRKAENGNVTVDYDVESAKVWNSYWRELGRADMLDPHEFAS
jgi:hypothetical protein